MISQGAVDIKVNLVHIDLGRGPLEQLLVGVNLGLVQLPNCEELPDLDSP